MLNRTKQGHKRSFQFPHGNSSVSKRFHLRLCLEINHNHTNRIEVKFPIKILYDKPMDHHYLPNLNPSKTHPHNFFFTHQEHHDDTD